LFVEGTINDYADLKKLKNRDINLLTETKCFDLEDKMKQSKK
jgi:hypothetical protein